MSSRHYWNSTYIADAVAHLSAIGEPAPDDLLAHTSPVGWGHIAFSGDFLWTAQHRWRRHGDHHILRARG